MTLFDQIKYQRYKNLKGKRVSVTHYFKSLNENLTWTGVIDNVTQTAVFMKGDSIRRIRRREREMIMIKDIVEVIEHDPV